MTDDPDAPVTETDVRLAAIAAEIDADVAPDAEIDALRALATVKLAAVEPETVADARTVAEMLVETDVALPETATGVVAVIAVTVETAEEPAEEVEIAAPTAVIAERFAAPSNASSPVPSGIPSEPTMNAPDESTRWPSNRNMALGAENETEVLPAAVAEIGAVLATVA